MYGVSIKQPFWLVWTPNGNNPAYQHFTEDSAISEAERLAKANPGTQFVVMESVCCRVVDSLQKIDLRPDSIAPF